MKLKIFNGLILSVTILALFFGTFFVRSVFALPGNPQGSVVIDEFVTNTGVGTAQWYELMNTTSNTIDLTNWTLSSAVNGELNIGTLLGTGDKTIPANGLLVVTIPYNPGDDAGDVLQIKDNTSAQIYAVSYGNQSNPPAPLHVGAPSLVQSAILTGQGPSATWSLTTTITRGWFNNAVNFGCSSGTPTDPSGGTTPPTLSSIADCLATSPTNVVTNMGSQLDPTVATDLYFEKSISGNPVGRITFAGPLNLTDQNTVSYLKSVGEKMEASKPSGGVKVGLDTSVNSTFTGEPGTVKMFGVTGSVEPSLIVRNNAGTIVTSGPDFPTISTSTGAFDSVNHTYEFSTSHFSSFSTEKKIVNITSGLGYDTIQEAITGASSGDTINIAAGTYKESNIRIDKSLTIQGTGALRNEVVVVPAAEDGNADNAFANSAQNGFVVIANNVTIKNLTVDGRGNPALTVGKNNFRAGIVTLDASQPGGGAWNNLHVDNVNIRYAYRRGISIFPTTVSGTLIENSNVENIALNHCMYVAGQSQILNNTIKHCFQGIVQALDTTTPAGLVKANSNDISEIGNFPGVWGDQGSGVSPRYQGQPRAIQFNNSDGAGRAVEIKNNSIDDVGSDGVSGTVGIYTRLANSDSIIDNNIMTMTSGASWAVDGGSQSVGMLLGWSYANGFMVTNNKVNSSGYGMGIMIFGMGTVAKPLTLEGNTITGVSSTRTTQGDGTGIYIANEYLFNGTDRNESYAIIQNDNSISGFVRGIDVEKVITSTQPLTVFVNNNSITQNITAIDATTLTSPLDATNNWWGTSYKPTIESKISGSVSFVPYYINSEKTALSDVKAITEFTIPLQVGPTTINEGAHTIELTMPYGTDVTALVPTITTTGTSTTPASGVPHNFTGAQTYTATAIDETTQNYTVTVNIAANSAKAISAFNFQGFSPVIIGSVNELDKTITLNVPYGTDLSALVPTITHSGASVLPASGDAQAFTDGVPVTYTVTAADSTHQDYAVTVNVLANTAKAFTSFSFAGLASGTIDEGAHTIAVTVPFGTDVTNLVASFTVSPGASVIAGAGVPQTSGVNYPHDFTTPFTYTVSAAAGGGQGYVVTVTISGDTTDPTGAITNIGSGQYLSGTTTINATASDTESGVEKVRFYYYSIGTLIGEDTTAPYSIDWNTRGLDGNHELHMVVFDKAGNQYDTGSIPVIVDNIPATTTKLGNGLSDYSLPSMGPGYGAVLVFSEKLDSTSKTAVQSALNVGAGKTLTHTWGTGDTSNELTITSSGTTATFANDVTATVSDLAGNVSTNLLLIDSKFQYIQDAIDSATSGATITIPAGTYSECLTINKPLTLTSSSAVNTIIDIAGCELGNGVKIHVSNVTFKNFTIINSGEFSGGHAVYVATEGDLTGITLDSLLMSTQSNNITGIYLSHASGQLTNSNIQNYCSGVYLAGSSNFTIDGNTISHNGTRTECTVATGIDVFDSSSVTIRNNTISDNDVGVYANNGSNSVSVNNNKITGNNGAFNDGVGAFGIKNDNLFNNINATTNWWGGGAGPTHSSNASGTGDKISNYVIYSPWYGDSGLTSLRGIPDEGDTYTLGSEDFIATSTNYNLTIPYDTTITGTSTWDGQLNPPTVIVTLESNPSQSGYTPTITKKIEVGYSGIKLTLSKAAKLVFLGEHGQKVGWTRPGVPFTEITTVCGAINNPAWLTDNQDWADANLGTDGDCKIDAGNDLVVWTKHFTQFATYSMTQNSTGGGGGGGGGGGIVGQLGVVNTVLTPALTAPKMAVQQTPSVSSGTVLGASAFVFRKDLKKGMTDGDVKELQKRLTSEGLYKEDITGYFGVLTLKAVKDYQTKYNLPPTGFVGPMTRGVLNGSSAVTAPVQGTATTTSTTTTSTPTFMFTKDLRKGMIDEEVKELQKRLTSEGLYAEDITGYFGVLTLKAVKDYQSKNNLPPTGYVGAMTRGVLNGTASGN